MIRASKRKRVAIRKDEGSLEDRLSEFFESVWTDNQKSAAQEQIVKALSAGNLDDVMRILDEIDKIKQARELAKILADIAKQSGLPALNKFIADFPRMAAAGVGSAGDNLAGGILNIAFDVVDTNVQNWAYNYSSQLIVQIDNETRATVRNLVGDAVSGRYTKQQLAGRIYRQVGLHDRYAAAVDKMYLRNLNAYMKQGSSMAVADAKASKLAARYADKLRRLRSRTISRTEIMFASNNGQYIGQTAAIASGMASPDVMKEWITAEDEDVCPVCGPLDHKQVPFTEPFSTGQWTPPAHPNCRCAYNLVPPEVPDDLLGHNFDMGSLLEGVSNA